KQSPSERGLDLQVACALLPEDKLLLEIQVQPEDVPTETIAGLRRSLEMLPRPRVRFGPVAFSSRSMVRGGCTQPGGGFGFPFASLLKPGKQGMLDDLLMEAGGCTPATESTESWWWKIKRAIGLGG